MPRLYDRVAWKRLRKQILHRDNYRCVRCHTYVGGKGMARIDHIEPLSIAPHRAFDPSNLRTFCATCDNRSHNEKARHLPYRIDKIVYGADARGMPLGPSHPWNVQSGGDPKKFEGALQLPRWGKRMQPLPVKREGDHSSA